MQITDVRVRKITKEGKMKAIVSITIDDEFVVHDGKKSEEECWKENFDFSSEQLKKDNIKDSMIFMDPDVLNGKEYKACGNRQIFVNVGGSFYVSDK